MAAEVRARHLKTCIQLLEELPEGEAIRGRMGAQDLKTIDEASAIGWLPIELNTDLARHVFEAVGASRCRDYFQQALLAGFETPILGTFIQGALRLAGHNPMVVLGRVPSGIDLVYRNTGRWAVKADGEGAAILELEEAPEVVAGDAVFLDMVGAALEAIFAKTGRDGRIELIGHEPDAGRASFRATWS